MSVVPVAWPGGPGGGGWGFLRHAHDDAPCTKGKRGRKNAARCSTPARPPISLPQLAPSSVLNNILLSFASSLSSTSLLVLLHDTRLALFWFGEHGVFRLLVYYIR